MTLKRIWKPMRSERFYNDVVIESFILLKSPIKIFRMKRDLSAQVSNDTIMVNGICQIHFLIIHTQVQISTMEMELQYIHD